MPLEHKPSELGTNITQRPPETYINLNTLSNNVLLEKDFLSEIIALFEDRKQAIFYGPPGTGKTYVARELAKYLTRKAPLGNGISPWLVEPVFWLMLSTEQRQYASNKIYDDVESSYYSWDSTVPNHEQVAAGDIIIIWDKKQLVGISVITSITTEETEKERGRCPECQSTKFKARISLQPKFKCFNCGHEFSEPTTEWIDVTAYRGYYSEHWISLVGQASAGGLRSIA